RVRLVLAVAGVVAEPGGEGEGRVAVGLVEEAREGLGRGRDARHATRGQGVVLPAQTQGTDPGATRAGEGEIAPQPEVGDLVGVARLRARSGVGAETEEAAGERPLVAAGQAQEAPLFLEHTALGEIPLVEPAAPDQAVALLPLGRLRDERAEELSPPLAAEVDVGEGEATPDPDVLLVEDLWCHEARHEEAFERTSGLDAAFGDVAPALGLG